MKIHTEDSGQALIEMALMLISFCTLLFASIDFARAIYDVEVMSNLAGEGSSMASRGTSLATTASNVVNFAGADINVSTKGCVIVTQVTNNAGTLEIPAGGQSTIGAACSSVGCGSSKIGSPEGTQNCHNAGSANLPVGASTVLTNEGTGFSIFVTEIFYTYNTITPIAQKWLGASAQLYSVAYY